MSSSWWSRVPAFMRLFDSLSQGVTAIHRGRRAAADGVRQIGPGARHLFSLYCGLLALLGMLTAGFVVFPVGLVLLLQGLLRDSVDRNLVGGMALCLVGLFYLFAPVLAIHTLSRLALGRLQRQVDSVADRVEGKR